MFKCSSLNLYLIFQCLEFFQLIYLLYKEEKIQVEQAAPPPKAVVEVVSEPAPPPDPPAAPQVSR